MDSDHQPVAFPRGRKLLHGIDKIAPSISSLSGELRRDEPLSLHTTIRVGGPADGFFLPASKDSLIEGVHTCREHGVPYFVLGSGSNVLFSDSGYRGLIISTARLSAWTIGEGFVLADCGVRLAELISAANARGISSLDFLAGIPGSVGGALAMNAGIKERAIGDIVSEVTVLCEDGAPQSIDAKACGFSYRTSSILKSRLPVLEARILLDGRTYDREQLLAQRAATQPLGIPSAGCTFKNPDSRSAGDLIERAGLKGFRVGRAQISDIHANFIINLGGARSAEIRRIIDIVREKVYKSFHILLDLEIEVVDG